MERVDGYEGPGRRGQYLCGGGIEDWSSGVLTDRHGEQAEMGGSGRPSGYVLDDIRYQAAEAGEAGTRGREDAIEPVGDYGRYSDDGYDTCSDEDQDGGEKKEDEEVEIEVEIEVEEDEMDEEAESESPREVVRVIVDTGRYSDDGYVS